MIIIISKKIEFIEKKNVSHYYLINPLILRDFSNCLGNGW